jgi:hypothetical protein
MIATTPQISSDRKALATQISRLALAGHHVNKGRESDYMVSKYCMPRYFQNFAEPQAFAMKLGVEHV